MKKQKIRERDRMRVLEPELEMVLAKRNDPLPELSPSENQLWAQIPRTGPGDPEGGVGDRWGDPDGHRSKQRD